MNVQKNDAKDVWSNNLNTEVDFWKWYAKNKNSSEVSLIERASIDREVIPLAKPLISSSNAKVLDVGSGPVSYLGYKYNDSLLNITLIDPLADEYNEILTNNNIPSQYIPVKCDGESLNEFFSNGEQFDFIYSRNALDHAYDPFKAISNMVGLLHSSNKSSILLEVQHNEGKFQSYNGLHQWNFDLTDNGDVRISNKDGVEHYLSSLNVGNELKMITASYNYCVPLWGEIKTYLIIVIFKNYDNNEVISYNSFLNSYILSKNTDMINDVVGTSLYFKVMPYVKKIINETYYFIKKLGII